MSIRTARPVKGQQYIVKRVSAAARRYMLGDVVVISEDDGSDEPYWDNLSNGEERVCITTSNLEEFPKTLSTLQPGDIIYEAGRANREREVVLANSEYVVTKDIYDGTNDPRLRTVSCLEEGNYKIKGHEEPVITELTLEDIAKKFNINVENVRIKE